MISRTTCCTFLFTLFLTLGCTPASEESVEVTGGRIAGVELPDYPVMVYRGIPYAAPPVGKLRWKAPQPVIPWNGVKAADTFSDACIQVLQRSRLPWSEEFMHLGEMSEDCLYLNVWTRAESPDEALPVMVYIHGGGMVEGSSAIAVYEGEELAKKGVVVVTLNYRLGPLGFMAHSELTDESGRKASGNWGLMDQAAALRWVHNNIEAFGGDPQNVTIFGQSAGARSVTMLMQSPLANKLFARAIIHSGWQRRAPGPSYRQASLKAAEAVGLAAQEALGVSSLAEMRAVDAARFLEDDIPRMGAIVDGYFMPTSPPEKQVPVMIGFTADDSFIDPFAEVTEEMYTEEAREQYGEAAGKYLELYPPSKGGDPVAASLWAARDQARMATALWASGQIKKSASIYTYYFDQAIPWPEHPEYGAFHTSDIPYVFNNLKMLDRPWTEADKKVAEQVSSYWVNFATDGDPNGSGLPAWPAFTPATKAMMRLGKDTHPLPSVGEESEQFWMAFFEKSPA